VLYIHPFAEEMNKARRMAALQARALAAHGLAVLQLDLHGCGDSSGDFGDARWDGWLDDIAQGCAWLRERSGRPPTLWGLRLGALLALDYAARDKDLASLLLWQPVLSGAACLTQFLRLRVAGDMLGSADSTSGGTKALRAALAAGETLEVAGYALAPALAAALDAADATKLTPPCPVHWIDVAAGAGGEPSPASARLAARWREAGAEVHLAQVQGEAFWATQEITECPALLEASLAALHGACHA
jgi:exosortase A-associated hydrolase 2